jgi:hypothetical protein
MVFAITRRVHLVRCGMPKSGTTSIATMLAPVLRARHEFEMDQAARVRVAQQAGEMKQSDVESWLVARDARCNAEVDSTSFLWTWSDLLPDVFPTARFVATVRDPRSWCRSLAGMLLAMGEVADTHRDWGRATVERDLGSQPLDDPRAFLVAAMDYWRQSAQAIATLPAERTWWCKTDDLSARAEELAQWARVHPDWLRRTPANTAVTSLDDVRSALADELVSAAITPTDDAIWQELSTLTNPS